MALAIVVAVGLPASGTPTASHVGAVGYVGCIANSASDGCVQASPASLANASGEALSTDGKDLYVASGSGAITWFARSRSGALTEKGCFADSGITGCVSLGRKSLQEVVGVVVSPDDKDVYVLSQQGSLNEFARTASGGLRFVGCLTTSSSVDCTATSDLALDDPTSLTVSPDGKSLFVDDYAGAIADFRRSASGALTDDGCIGDDDAGAGCQGTGHETLMDGGAIGVSPDNRYLYVAGLYITGMSSAGTITEFRLGLNRSLTYVTCIADYGANGCQTAAIPVLGSGAALAFADRGRQILWSTSYAGALVEFDRNATTGALSNESCITAGSASGCATAPGFDLGGLQGLAISPDGKSVYVTQNTSPGAVARFGLSSNGRLTYAACYADGGVDGCTMPAGDTSTSTGALSNADAVSVSPDSGTVYVTGHTVGTVVRFRTTLSAPNTTIGRVQVKQATAKITFHSSEPSSTFECRIDHQKFRACHSPFTYRHLTKGKHAVQVRAVNAQGASDHSPAAKTFHITSA